MEAHQLFSAKYPIEKDPVKTKVLYVSVYTKTNYN